MRQVEEYLFSLGMPVAALMEKAALLISDRLQQLYPVLLYPQVGILVGPGHNGGDALVIARELWLGGYQVQIYCPFNQLKALTKNHTQYAQSLGISFVDDVSQLQKSDFLVDGLFGFGLTRALTDNIAEIIIQVNQWQLPIASIDIPSGLHTDTGELLGVAIRASQSFCLGLWKLAYFQDQALPYLGQVERLDFGIPAHFLQASLAHEITPKILSQSLALDCLPLPRPLLAHKYQQGHLLLICGSRRYAGGAILAALGARASGIGMLSIAVPAALKPLLVSHLPEALIIDCPETTSGAIADLPSCIEDFSQYSLIAIGPGLTLECQALVSKVLKADIPVIIDADGLTSLAQLGVNQTLSHRSKPTILTPHLGEFKRLFPELNNPNTDRIQSVQQAAKTSQGIILLKGARTAIAAPDGQTWLIPKSTPALARGGSGDVLTGLMGGLLAQSLDCHYPLAQMVATAAWWHAQAGILAVKERTELGVDAFTLSQYLIPAIQQFSES
jgi:NAD(P)H-hydrate epimerase